LKFLKIYKYLAHKNQREAHIIFELNNQLHVMLTVCKSNLDKLPFEDAFNSARLETSSTGIFFWRGEPYHTLLAEERASLTPEEWEAYGEAIRETLASMDWIVPEVVAPDPSDWTDLQPDPIWAPSTEPNLNYFSTNTAPVSSGSWFADFFSPLFAE
jgi:hypothetical protein